jgi:hypothetical protein
MSRPAYEPSTRELAWGRVGTGTADAFHIYMRVFRADTRLDWIVTGPLDENTVVLPAFPAALDELTLKPNDSLIFEATALVRHPGGWPAILPQAWSLAALERITPPDDVMVVSRSRN